MKNTTEVTSDDCSEMTESTDLATGTEDRSTTKRNDRKSKISDDEPDKDSTDLIQWIIIVITGILFVGISAFGTGVYIQRRRQEKKAEKAK